MGRAGWGHAGRAAVVVGASPPSSFGTLEVRVRDAQATIAETAALAATIHALVAALRERYCAGERAAPVAAWRIDENRWSACRDGVAGTMADPLTGDCESTRERLRRLLAGLLAHAERLGCASALLDASRPASSRWTLARPSTPNSPTRRCE